MCIQAENASVWNEDDDEESTKKLKGNFACSYLGIARLAQFASNLVCRVTYLEDISEENLIIYLRCKKRHPVNILMVWRASFLGHMTHLIAAVVVSLFSCYMYTPFRSHKILICLYLIWLLVCHCFIATLDTNKASRPDNVHT